MFTRNQLGHIQIHAEGYLDKPSLYNTIDSYKAVGQKIQSIKGIESWAPGLYSAGLASVGGKSTGVRISGIDPQLEVKATRFDKKITAGKNFSASPSHEVILGTGLAKTLKAEIGNEIAIVSQAADGSIANDLYKIIGIVESGNDMSDKVTFYLHLKDAQELLVLDNRIHEIIVICQNLSRVDELTQKIERTLQTGLDSSSTDETNLSVASWQEFAKSFYQAMKADQQGMWIMLFVIILIVAVGVLNTVLMSVLERTREYGVLRAMGTKPTQIFALVLYEVNIMAIGSIILGCGFSALINYLLSIYGITLPEPFTYGGIEFKNMYTEVNARSLYIPAITVILSATLITVLPAIKAARIAPAKAMRMH
jgi:ABC-type lipoprotein release transport system permease subunit